MQRRLREVYARAKGNAVRMGEILADEHDLRLPYSTLTRWVREAELREPPRRSGEYGFAPGEEGWPEDAAARAAQLQSLWQGTRQAIEGWAG